MLKLTRAKRSMVVLAFLLSSFIPAVGRAEDPIETAGITVGLTAGNILFLPLKAISVSIGVLSGGLSYVVSGGNADLTRQIWQDTTQGPYLITPEVAKKAVGERPELSENK
jgi:predicted permease